MCLGKKVININNKNKPYYINPVYKSANFESTLPHINLQYFSPTYKIIFTYTYLHLFFWSAVLKSSFFYDVSSNIFHFSYAEKEKNNIKNYIILYCAFN